MEVEARVKVNDLDKIKQRLTSIGADFFERNYQIDSVYKTKGKELEPLGPGAFILRIRESGKGNKLTYKNLTETPGVIIEYETNIDNPNEMRKIIESSGFGLVYTMEKERTSGKLRDFKLCLDNVKEIGTYLEVELQSEDGDGAMNKIKQFFKKIGFPENEITTKGYSLMIFEKLGVTYVKGYEPQ